MLFTKSIRLSSSLCRKYLSTAANIIVERPLPGNVGVVTMTLARDVGKNSFSKAMLQDVR
jgi:hypothetical protein